MRRRSLAFPILLVLLGGLLLANNIRPDLPMFEMLATYWPFLLIGWGLIRLVEIFINPASIRSHGGGFTGGEVVLIVFICLIGSGLFAAHHHGIHWRARGFEMFGENFDYSVSEQKAAGPKQHILLDNVRGNLRVTGGDVQEMKVTGRKVVRAMSRPEADRINSNSPVEIRSEGDRLVLRTNLDRVENDRIGTDLEIAVPKDAVLEVRGNSGDYDVNDVAGEVTIGAGRGDIRLARIGGNVRIESGRSDLVRAVDLKGSLDLQGKGKDIELESIAGQVTINGSYSGNLDFKNLAKPLHFESPNTDLRVEATPGSISMDLGDFTARNIRGPMRLVTKSKDVHLEDFTDSLELETERGDINLTPGKVPVPKIEARSRSGKIELALPDKAGFQLQATAERGDAINDFGPGIEKETEGRRATLKGKVGQGPTIHLVAERGTISVRKAGGTTLTETKF